MTGPRSVSREPQVFFATCVPGAEAALLAEVKAARLGRPEAQVGGVRFQGIVADGWRAVLHLRVALRIYRQLARFAAATAEDLYKGACSVAWDRVMGPEHTLAAAAVGLTGWDGKSPFLDPFCGSGTLLIEAGLLAANVAPGLLGSDFSFARLPGFDLARWEEMRSAALAAVQPPRRRILRGGDVDPAAVEATRRNAEAAGVGDLVRVEVADARDVSPTPGWGATVLSNPPYG
ncbi:MAG: hypothetical protein HY900_34915, partial [Deltaproteobacteria bacterium]|nr:hypothetical protein [Deltaproteobacteria bacterium]